MPAAQPGPRPACDGAPSRRRTRCSSDPPVAASASCTAHRAAPRDRPAPGRRRTDRRTGSPRGRRSSSRARSRMRAGQPPDRRVVEEQRLDQRLQQVDQIVVAADVRELVREDGLELVRATAPASALAGSSTTGRSQPITVGTSTAADSSSRTGRAMCSRRAQPRGRPLPAVGGRCGAMPLHPLDPQPAARQPQRQQRRRRTASRPASSGSHGPDGSTGVATVVRTRRRRRERVALRSRISRRRLASSGRSRSSATPASQSPPRRRAVRVRAARRCTAVTTGIVGISAGRSSPTT